MFMKQRDMLGFGAISYLRHDISLQTAEVKIPFSINIDHLHRSRGDQEPGRLPDMSQPPPSMAGGLPPSSLALPTSAASSLPLPTKFTRYCYIQIVQIFLDVGKSLEMR